MRLTVFALEMGYEKVSLRAKSQPHRSGHSAPICGRDACQVGGGAGIAAGPGNGIDDAVGGDFANAAEIATCITV